MPDETVTASASFENPAVVIVRKSEAATEKDLDSLTRQEADARSYCDRKGLTVVAVYPEVGTAFGAKRRPVLEKAIRDVERGRARHIVFARGDRFTRRGPRVALNLLHEIQSKGGRLHLLDVGSGEIDIEGEMSEGVLSILADTWKVESMRISKRVKSAVGQQVAEGARHGGVRPYGTHRAPKSGPEACPSCGEQMTQHRVKGKLVAVVEPCPVETARIRTFAELKIEGKPLYHIAKIANEKGWPTAKGFVGQWRAQTISNILSSPGIRGERVDRNGNPNPTAWTPAISTTDHDKVLSAIRRRYNKNAGVPSLLGGLKLLRCGRCERFLHVSSPDKPGGKGRYSCPPTAGGAKKDPKDPSKFLTPCGACSGIQENVDNRVIELLLDDLRLYLQNPERLNSAENRAKCLREDRQKKQDAIDELIEDYHNGRHTRETYDKHYDRLQAELNDINKLLDAIQGGETLKNLPEPGQDPQEWWDSLKDLNAQRRVLVTLLSKITLMPVGSQAGCKFRPERVTITPRYDTILRRLVEDDTSLLPGMQEKPITVPTLIEEAHPLRPEIKSFREEAR